jgi:hypothetical protein
LESEASNDSEDNDGLASEEVVVEGIDDSECKKYEQVEGE